MRTFILALGAAATLGLAVPAVSTANAQEAKVVIKSGHRHHSDWRRHYGWERGHHYGWRHHHRSRTVVIHRD